MIAVSSFNTIVNSNWLTTAANTLVTALNTARMEAIKRNASVQFCSNTTTTSTTVLGGAAGLSTPVQPSGDIAAIRFNAHGGFHSATNPQTFTSGLTEAVKRAAGRVGTGASLAANSTQLTDGTVAHQANYYTAKWTGDLKSLAINSSTGVISTTPTWTAANMLNASATTSGSVSTYPNRNIVTYVPPASSTSSGSFVAFQNASGAPPSLPAPELSALGSSAAAQMQMVNHLRGDNTLEQKNRGTFHDRDTPLGDIVDSHSWRPTTACCTPSTQAPAPRSTPSCPVR